MIQATYINKLLYDFKGHPMIALIHFIGNLIAI